MIIALDYDGTYTADPDLWNAFINKALDNKHRVIVVTMRTVEEGALIDPRLSKGFGDRVQIFCTARKAKKKFMRLQGIEPNIWIDDQPDWLYEDSL